MTRGERGDSVDEIGDLLINNRISAPWLAAMDTRRCRVQVGSGGRNHNGSSGAVDTGRPIFVRGIC